MAEESAVGLGFDIHPRDADRELWLGGVLFEGEPGLSGHSDGDVVCHAIADALLGAVALGDVGQHFPEADPDTAGLAGADLLARTVRILLGAGRAPVSLDATVVCDRPQIAPRRDDVRRRLAEVADLPLDRVSLKATRPEGLGLSGDGVGCLAIAMVR